MIFTEDNAGRVEALFREHLEEAFQGTLTFDPIQVEATQNLRDEDAFHVTVFYDGDRGLLDPAKLNAISSRMVDQLLEPGIGNTVIESYVELKRASTPAGGSAGKEHGDMSDGANRQGRLATARALSGGDKQRDQTELKSAVDSCYFSMFHALCRSNAQALAGRQRTRCPGAWSRVYMGMDEKSIAERFRRHRPQACNAVKEFGACFAIMQEHRDRAMERPGSTFRQSEVATLVERAESAIPGLLGASAEERRLLGINLLVGTVRGQDARTDSVPDWAAVQGWNEATDQVTTGTGATSRAPAF